MEKIRATISRNLSQLRNRHRYTQGEVADAIGISQSRYSRMEAGEVDISAVFLKSLARFYQESIMAFYLDGGKEENHEVSDEQAKFLESKYAFSEELLRIARERNEEYLAKIKRKDQKIEELKRLLA